MHNMALVEEEGYQELDDEDNEDQDDTDRDL
jgi:hypothetical protein